MGYKNILVAIDLSADAKQVVTHALDLAQQHQSKLNLIHVVEPVFIDNSYDLITTLPAELDSSSHKRATEFLNTLADDLKIDERQLYIETGAVKTEILRVATEYHIDLIVVGTHGRHGVSLLLGSTSNSILHGTPCDVLAVRIGDLKH